MKKIGIVTFQRALNYGALLQMYALHKFIAQHFANYDVEVVDYFSPLCEKECTIRSIRGRNLVLSSLKKANFLMKRHRFSKFIKNEIKISKRYTSKTIYKAADQYHILISGSDQVWNPNIIDNDMNYLLAFSNSSVKVSYAASIGKNELPYECVKDYKEQLEQFKCISVREDSAKQVVDNIMGSCRTVVNVDPTLLLESEQWQQIANKKINHRYLFVYQVRYSQSLLDKAKEYALSSGLEVFYVGPFTKTKGIKYIPAPSVHMLLSLFKNADYVFTNSFHGTVFSIQFNKQFYVDLLFSDGRNDRITDLLKICGLERRMDISSIELSPDWESVHNELKSERERSLNYLHEAIGEIE